MCARVFVSVVAAARRDCGPAGRILRHEIAAGVKQSQIGSEPAREDNIAQTVHSAAIAETGYNNVLRDSYVEGNHRKVAIESEGPCSGDRRCGAQSTDCKYRDT